ncbi:small basic protein [Halolactibacillus alkaliphilus]|uniref:Small basic protein n=1 Tax=Halolactibacillus alkaliphilus TaxID=442899 RepID=A0A511WX61_9BACI|nr:small basic family protein [Halolactibacillus alkaliphilus]GEN55700.1 small basic protein [Halolactibacillus alkaliphilus]GGN65341.1 small basic protein [Halolactibacillus alkaliphilus]SFO63898.1 Small basic protein [Halolactibacillus alkaliphilus]
MWLSLLFLAIGIGLGLLSNFSIPAIYSNYISIAILAAFDTLLGGIRAHFEHVFNQHIFVTGFFFNITLAIFLTFIGEQLGVDLYLAAVFAFGWRLFQNIAIIRRRLFDRWEQRKLAKTNKPV